MHEKRSSLVHREAVVLKVINGSNPKVNHDYKKNEYMVLPILTSLIHSFMKPILHIKDSDNNWIKHTLTPHP